MKRLSIAICYTLLFLFSLSFANGEQVEIRILHVNDFHGFAEPYKTFGSNERVGGIAYLAAKVEELRKERPSFLLSAGDMIQGNNWANLFQGESVIELMNEMRFDAMVVGNHEFDFGPEVLKKRVSEASFPVLGANVKGLKTLTPYIIKELRGVKIAIIGLVTEDVPISTHPRNIPGIKFSSPMDTVEKYVKVREVLVAGRPIHLEKEYIVATHDFLAVGGDGYKAFGEAIKTSRDFSVIGGMMKGEKVVYSDSGRWLRDVVVEYIKEKGRVAPKAEGRIKEIR